MSILFSCPACRTKIEVPSQLAGRKGKCKGCGGPVVIPVPHVLSPPKPSAAKPLEQDEPYGLSDADEIDELDEVEEIEEIGDEHLAAASAALPKRRVAPAVKKEKPKSVRRKQPSDPNGTHPLMAMIAGVLGILFILLGLLVIDGAARMIMLLGMSRMFVRSSKLFLGLMIIILGTGVLGLGSLLRLIRPTAGTETVEGSRSTATMIVGVLVVLTIGLRLFRGGEAPALLLNVIQMADQAQNGNRGIPTARNFESEAKQKLEVDRLVSELVAPELERRIAAAQALAAIRPGPQDQPERVRPWIHKLFTEGRNARIAAMHAIARWGDGSEVAMFQVNMNDPDPEIAQAAREAIEVAKQPR